jgi:hypothetical protein
MASTAHIHCRQKSLLSATVRRQFSAYLSWRTGEQSHVNNHLAGVLTKYSREVMEILEEVEHSGAAIEQRDVLVKRWKQIRDLVNVAIAALQS